MSKSPVAILHELCARKKEILRFELVATLGESHKPTFKYKLHCFGHSVEGEGSNKKDTRQVLGIKMLRMLAQDTELNVTLPDSLIVEEETMSLYATDTAKTYNNVGALSDLIISNSFSAPKYKCVSAIGPDHMKVFTVKCQFYQYFEMGTSKRKSAAKAQAALKMLLRVRPIMQRLTSKSLYIGEEMEACELRLRDISTKFVNCEINQPRLFTSDGILMDADLGCFTEKLKCPSAFSKIHPDESVMGNAIDILNELLEINDGRVSIGASEREGVFLVFLSAHLANFTACDFACHKSMEEAADEAAEKVLKIFAFYRGDAWDASEKL